MSLSIHFLPEILIKIVSNFPGYHLNQYSDAQKLCNIMWGWHEIVQMVRATIFSLFVFTPAAYLKDLGEFHRILWKGLWNSLGGQGFFFFFGEKEDFYLLIFSLDTLLILQNRNVTPFHHSYQNNIMIKHFNRGDCALCKAYYCPPDTFIVLYMIYS